MIKKWLLLFAIIIFPRVVYADSYYADIYVKSNSDIEVHEATVKDGAYNYLQRQLIYGYDESIYNASNIFVTKICESDKDNPLTNIGSCFTKVNSAKEGSNLVYVEKNKTNAIDYTLYNTNANKSAFYMEYVLKNAFVDFNDISEALITLFSQSNEENFAKIEIKIHYPDNENGYSSWMHGPIWLENKMIDNYLLITAENFSAKETLDLRIMAPKGSIISSKSKDIDRKEAILELEKGLEEKRIEKQNKENTKHIFKILTIVAGTLLATFYMIGLGVLVFKHYFAGDKEVSSDFNDEYFTEFPSKDSPAAIEYLFNRNVSLNSFKATILYIIYKKGFLVKMLDDDFELIINNHDLIEPLTDSEISLRDFLVINYGDGSKIKLYDIDKAFKKNKILKIFFRFFNNWRYEEIHSGVKKRFYETGASSTFTVMYCLAPFFLSLLGVFYKPLYLIMLLCIFSFSVLVYLSFSTRRTKEGNELYYRWRALRLFMEDIVTYEDKLPSKKEWGKYLAYASVFGQGKMVASNIIERMGDDYVYVYGIDANGYILLVDMLNNVFEVK